LFVAFTRLRFPSLPSAFCASDTLCIGPLAHCFEQIMSAAAPTVLLRLVLNAQATMPTSARHASENFTSVVPAVRHGPQHAQLVSKFPSALGSTGDHRCQAEPA
jgi:hypothetical protein